MEFPYRKSGYIHVDSLHMYSFILKTAYSANDCYNKEQTFLLFKTEINMKDTFSVQISKLAPVTKQMHA